MNELKQIDDFRKVLKDYKPSEEAKRVLGGIRLALFVGPSSSGRNTIINELVKTGPYHYIVSDTTRQPRENNGVMEQNGKEYWFRQEADVLADLRSGEFLEAAVIHNQQVSGISMRELKTAAKDSKIAVNEVEVVGAANIYKAKPDTIFLFVVPPSFDEWMARMSARGQLPADELRRRLESAVEEVKDALARSYYTFVVNDTFMQAAKRVDAIIRERIVDEVAETTAREVARQLLADTQNFLACHATN